MTEHDDLLRKFSKQIDPTDEAPASPEAEAPPLDQAPQQGAPDSESRSDVSRAAKVDLAEPPVSRIETAMIGGESGFSHPAKPAGFGKLTMLLLGLVLIGLVGGYLLLQSEPPELPETINLPEKYSVPVRPEKKPAVEQPISEVPEKSQEIAELSAEKLSVTEKQVVAAEVKDAIPSERYLLRVGPFVSKSTLEAAATQLRDMGYQPQQIAGRGMVPMIRLLEGVYPAEEARKRLKVLKEKVESAFILPTGDKRALYAGSFYDAERAEKLRSKLAARGIKLTAVTSELEMDGKLLIVDKADQQSALQAATAISDSGLQVQMIPR